MRKRSKVFSLIIMLSMLISSVSTVYAQVLDVEKHWAKEEISYMLDKGFLTGYPDGTFRPEDNVSKAEFYRIINNLMGYTEKAEFGFKDVKSEDWFYNDVAKGIKAGYLVDAEFLNPRDFITREEVARIIGVTFKLSENVESTTYFKDYTLISPSAAGFIGTLKDEGYITGFPDGNFGPTNNITRAEVVKMLYNILIAEGIPQKVDLTAYNAALAKVKQADYTKESWTAYQKVVLANVVTEKNSQEEVDAATKAIIAAQNKLVKSTSNGTVYVPTNPIQKADLTAYNAALAAVKQSDYTEESWIAYQKVVLANVVTENNTQARVNEATQAITNAQKDLVKIEVPVDPAITNVLPNSDVSLKVGDTLEISFNAPTGGEGYFNILMLTPTVMTNNNIGYTMHEEEPGLYSAIWTVPKEIEETGLQVQVIYITKEGIRLEKIAEGRLTIVFGEEPVEVDKTDLAAKIAEAQALNEEDYTNQTWQNLQAVLIEAIAVNENAETTQEQVNAALAALDAAIKALEVKPIEPAIINIMPNEDITLNAGETLTVSFNAPEGGIAYFRILLSEQTPMRNMDDTSINSNDNYKNMMNEVSPGLYSASWTVYDGVIGSWEIEVNYEKDNVKLRDIAEGKVIIVEKPVVLPVDKTDLSAAIVQAQAKVEEEYTEESWAPFEEALSLAIAVNNNEEATQEQVDEALANLTTAMEALVEKEGPVDPEVDKTELAAAIVQAQTKNEEDYTVESWAPFEEALSLAIAVNNNEGATQEQVDEALLNLNVAMNALVEENIPTPSIIATFHKAFIANFGHVSVQVQNIERAAKFDVVFHLSDNPDGSENIEQTEVVDISQRAGLIFYDPSQFNTITVRIYDINNNLLYTFEDVLPVMGN